LCPNSFLHHLLPSISVHSLLQVLYKVIPFD